MPVTNAQGVDTARHVQAQLKFLPSDMHRSFAPNYPTRGEWFSDHGPETEVNLPGNGAARVLDEVSAVVIRGHSTGLTAALLSCVLPISQLGWPALSVPIGATTAFGAQVVGRPYEEPLLLRIAAVIERLLPWSERRPAEPIGRRA